MVVSVAVEAVELLLLSKLRAVARRRAASIAASVVVVFTVTFIVRHGTAVAAELAEDALAQVGKAVHDLAARSFVRRAALLLVLRLWEGHHGSLCCCCVALRCVGDGRCDGRCGTKAFE